MHLLTIQVPLLTLLVLAITFTHSTGTYRYLKSQNRCLQVPLLILQVSIINYLYSQYRHSQVPLLTVKVPTSTFIHCSGAFTHIAGIQKNHFLHYRCLQVPLLTVQVLSSAFTYSKNIYKYLHTVHVHKRASTHSTGANKCLKSHYKRPQVPLLTLQMLAGTINHSACAFHSQYTCIQLP